MLLALRCIAMIVSIGMSASAVLKAMLTNMIGSQITVLIKNHLALKMARSLSTARYVILLRRIVR